jgi:hypothetical protein
VLNDRAFPTAHAVTEEVDWLLRPTTVKLLERQAADVISSSIDAWTREEDHTVSRSLVVEPVCSEITPVRNGLGSHA